jgi:hypothetical protein
MPQDGAMSTPATLDDSTLHPDISDRMHRVEGEVAELRHTVAELADIVVGDIRERREAAIAVSAPVPEVSIPASLVPGGETTIKAVNSLRRPWLLFDLIREFGITAKMYMDSRYRVRRGTQLLVPLILILFGLNYLVFNYTILDVPVFKHIFESLIEIVLAVLLYKVLMREVARYRQVIAQFAMGGRARAVPASLLNSDPDAAAHSRLETH